MENLRFLDEFRRQMSSKHAAMLTMSWSTPAISWKWCKSWKILKKIHLCYHPVASYHWFERHNRWCGWHSKNIQNSLLWYLFDVKSSSDEKDIWHGPDIHVWRSHSKKPLPSNRFPLLTLHIIVPSQKIHHSLERGLFDHDVNGFSLKVDPTFIALPCGSSRSYQPMSKYPGHGSLDIGHREKTYTKKWL